MPAHRSTIGVIVRFIPMEAPSPIALRMTGASLILG